MRQNHGEGFIIITEIILGVLKALDWSSTSNL